MCILFTPIFPFGIDSGNVSFCKLATNSRGMLHPWRSRCRLRVGDGGVMELTWCMHTQYLFELRSADTFLLLFMILNGVLTFAHP